MSNHEEGAKWAGYASPRYAEALTELGTPRLLPRSEGWLLERPIPGTDLRDAMGPYPLFACRDWKALGADLADVGVAWVSVVLVADPFGDHDLPMLERVFNGGVTEFKRHYVADLSQPLEKTVASHHRRNVRKAAQKVDVERLSQPLAALDEWARLYDNLIRRHDITGPATFSTESFARQLGVPGLVAFRARCSGETVGMLLFFVQGDIAYYHLGAYSDTGYERGAAFALFWVALQELSGEVRQVSLGGDAGLTDSSGGLARFKRGWASGERTAYLCRHIGDAQQFEVLSRASPATPFFPPYRGSVVAAPASFGA